MELTKIVEMNIPRGNRIEVGIAREKFGHVGHGILASRRVGYFGRIEEGKEPKVVLYHEILGNDNFSGNPTYIPVGEITYIAQLLFPQLGGTKSGLEGKEK